MTVTVILLIALSIIAAAALSFYQYYYKAGRSSNVTLLLAFLRFIAVLGILLLLINPRITKSAYEIQKTPLPIVVDNSASVADLKANEQALALYKMLSGNAQLQQKFDIQSYAFSNDLASSEIFDFKGTQTNLEVVARDLNSINRNLLFPTILITDGNQTTGNDYVYAFDPANKVYPLVVGDTTTFTDLRISQLNVNKYAFHKNKFPVEVFVQYSGSKSINATFSILQGNTVISKQTLSFTNRKKSEAIRVLLPANKVGLQLFRATLSSAEKEKNTYNNSKNFAVEIIDQKSDIAIVSAISHPDLGALKRAIETNSERKVTLLKPSELSGPEDYNAIVLYQPTAAFKPVYDRNKTAAVNTLTITGTATDFAFLNQQQTYFSFKMSGQREDYLATFEPQFNLFAAEDIGFENLPPLQHPFGTITVNGNSNTLLSARIRNIATGAPLLAFTEERGQRAALLAGEHIWKWRLQSHVNHGSFEKFDLFADKIIQFLVSDNKRKSLVVNHERFYNSGDALEITAQYFNKNYEFDEKARLMIAVTNRKTKQLRKYDLLKGSNAFSVNLDGLPAGQYDFTVQELNSRTRYNGHFEVLDFDIEKQFVNPDLQKLQQLADRTAATAFMPDQAAQLVKALLDNDDYKAIQKAVIKKVPLIDSLLLLGLIVLALALEWFIRKYNGML